MNPTFRQMETSAREVHENMNAVIDYQTHHRLRETQGRHRAEDLNERTMIWSVFVTFAIMCVGFGQVVHHACSQLCHLVLQHLTALDNQNSIISFTHLCSLMSQVFVLKSFFSEKRPSQMYGAH
jgi:hypothetical protein